MQFNFEIDENTEKIIALMLHLDIKFFEWNKKFYSGSQEDIIEKAKKNKLTSLNDINDDFINDNFKLAEELIVKDNYNLFVVENEKEYYVLTDNESTELAREKAEELIEDCYLYEFRKENKNHPILQYIDIESWIEDWSQEKCEMIAAYDNCTNEETVNGTTYYIYRWN